MKKISARWFASVSLIITVVVAGRPLAGRAAPEVVAWGDNTAGQTDVPSGLSNVVGIAAGWYHSLALTVDGRVVAWGAGKNNADDWPNFGQSIVPAGLSNVVAIAAELDHSLALTAEGRVVAWGSNAYGVTNVPSGLSNVVAIAAGSGHSLALTAEGRVGAWGNNEDGQTGGPSGFGNVVAIAAGFGHSLVLTAEGRVLAWGANEYGQTTVPSGLSNVVAIAAGHYHSLALTAEGWVAAWGANGYGQTTVPSGLGNVVALAAGGDHSLALTGLPPGVVAPAWVGPRFLMSAVGQPFQHRIMARNGASAYGAIGLPAGLALDSTTGLITGQPAQTGRYDVVLSATNRVGWSSWTVTLCVIESAAPVITSSGVVQALLGSGFSYAVVADNVPEWYGATGLPTGLVIDARTGIISGVPVAFGEYMVSLVASNRYGLGTTGLLTISVSPVVAWDGNGSPTTVPSGLSNVVAIAAGGAPSLALTAAGRIVGWGHNEDGSTTVPSGLSNVVAIAVGGFHSLALMAEGRVVAWGAGGPGTTGIPNYGQTNVPSGLNNVVAIAAGQFHSLALTTEGQVVAWGKYYDGSTYLPMTVPSGLSNVVAIAAGGVHSLALTAGGAVVAWGSNNDGRGRWAGQATVPGGLNNVVAIAAGDWNSLALTADGRVVGWGVYYVFGSYLPMNVPSGLSRVVAIASGSGYYSLALTADGRVVGWGVIGFNVSVPSGLSNVVAIAVGGMNNLALLQQPTVPMPRLQLSRAISGLELQAQGAPGISCLLLRASRMPGPWLPTEPVTFTNSAHRLRPPDSSESSQFFRLLRK